MASNIFLNTFWPILKVLQILGMFPIKKSPDFLCGFKAIPAKKYIFLVVSIFILGNGAQIVASYYIMCHYDKNLWELQNVMFGTSGSLMDNIDVIGFSMLMVLSNLGLILGNLSLKNPFIDLLELFEGVEITSTKNNIYKMKVVLFSFVFLWGSSIAAFGFVFIFALIQGNIENIRYGSTENRG